MDGLPRSNVDGGSIQLPILPRPVRAEVLQVNTMALTHQVSEIIHIKLDKNKQGYPVIEMEFKFIRYRLVIDDQKKGQEIKDLLEEILNPAERIKSEKIPLPNFYKKGVKK